MGIYINGEEATFTMGKNNLQIIISGPKSSIAKQTAFTVLIKNIITPSFQTFPQFTVGLMNSQNVLLEVSTKALTTELAETIPLSVVKITSVIPTKQFQGDICDYSVGFQIINAESEKIQEIIVNLSPKYYGYAIASNQVTCSLFEGTTRVTASCYTFGKSALKLKISSALTMKEKQTYYVNIVGL